MLTQHIGWHCFGPVRLLSFKPCCLAQNIERKWEDMEVLSSCVADNAHWLAPADAVKCLDKLASVGLCNSNAYMAVADALHKNRGVDVLSGNDVVHLLWALAKSETVHEGLLEHIVKVRCLCH